MLFTRKIIILFLVGVAALVMVPDHSVYAVTISGQVAGSFTGTINYQAGVKIVSDGQVSGTWTYDSDTSVVSFTATFATSGLSGNMTGAYSNASQNIAGTFTLPGSSITGSFALPLNNPVGFRPGIDPYVFTGPISGTAPTSQGPVTFTITPTLELKMPVEQRIAINGNMTGTWNGTVNGSYTVAGLPVSGSFSNVPASGTYSGTWGAGYNLTAGTLDGTFNGTFGGSAVYTAPVIGLLTIPVQGTYVGTIARDAQGTVNWNGSWQELLATGGTQGVHDGYGGDFSLVLGSELDFPFSISGTPSGGGSFTATYGGFNVTVTYMFSGNYAGTVSEQAQ